MAGLRYADVRSAADLGRLVRELRRGQGLTQIELGELAAVGPRFVGELERGKGSVQLDKVLALLAVLGASVKLEYAEPA